MSSINCLIFTESSIRLAVNPTKYLMSGDWVTISWQYVNSPSNYDWIGLYSPPRNDIYRINPALQAPIKVQVLKEQLAIINVDMTLLGLCEQVIAAVLSHSSMLICQTTT